MAWELRGNNLYYYRKRRVGSRVLSEYVGKGEMANMLYEMDCIERREQQVEQEGKIKGRECLKRIDRDLSDFEYKLKCLVKANLLNRGFYQTSSREWRYKK